MAPPGVLIVTGCTALVVAVRCCCCPNTAHRTPCASRAPRCQDRCLICPTAPQMPATPSILPAASHQRRPQLQTGRATHAPHRAAAMPAETPHQAPCCCAPHAAACSARRNFRRPGHAIVRGTRPKTAAACGFLLGARGRAPAHARTTQRQHCGTAPHCLPRAGHRADPGARAPRSARARTRARDAATARLAPRAVPGPAAPHPQGLHRTLFRPNTYTPPPPAEPRPVGGSGATSRASPWRLHTDGRARANVAGAATGVRAKLLVRARRAPERASMALASVSRAASPGAWWGIYSVTKCIALP